MCPVYENNFGEPWFRFHLSNSCTMQKGIHWWYNFIPWHVVLDHQWTIEIHPHILRSIHRMYFTKKVIVFSYKYCKIFKNTYFEQHLRRAASVFLHFLCTQLKLWTRHDISKRLFTNHSFTVLAYMVRDILTELVVFLTLIWTLLWILNLTEIFRYSVFKFSFYFHNKISFILYRVLHFFNQTMNTIFT